MPKMISTQERAARMEAARRARTQQALEARGVPAERAAELARNDAARRADARLYRMACDKALADALGPAGPKLMAELRAALKKPK